MSKPKRRQRTYSTDGLTVKTKTGKKRGFTYQIPPEVADRLPPHATVKIVSFTRAEIFDLASQVEPHIIQLLAERSAKNPLEALLLLVQGIYTLLQPPEMPIPHKDLLEISNTLAFGYPFSPTWPYAVAQMQAAMTPGHPDLRPDIPDQQVLLVAQEVEKRLLVQLKEEGVVLRDAIQSGMLMVTMIHKMVFDESAIFGADHHEMYHIARVLVASYTFNQAWPYHDQVKAALCLQFGLHLS